MLPPRWYKVIHDLWSNRTRTVIVALAVAVGVYAMGGVLATQAVLLREFHADRTSAAIAHAIIRTNPFDAQLAEHMAGLPGVAAAEGRATLIDARVLVNPTTSRDLVLEAVADFADQQVDRYLLLAGRWPSEHDEIALEWMGLDYLGVQIGGVITVELSDQSLKLLTVTASVHNPRLPSPEVMGYTTGVVAPETLRLLGRSDQFTELRLRVAEDKPDPATVRAVTQGVEEQFERTGRTIAGTTIAGESIIESIVNTAVLILSTFGWVILLLSAFLVVNTISALISQQINQIGIMKLVGASQGQITRMYIGLVLVYGLIANAIGVPLSVGTMYLLMTQLVEGLVNLRTDSYAVPGWVYATMIGVGLLIPVAAGLLPVWQGTRISCAAALQALSGDTTGSSRRHLGRALLGLTHGWLGRLQSLALRNALRHRGRLVRTVAVLTLGTALYIAVISTRASVDATLADFLGYHQYDVQVQMVEPQRRARLEAVARAHPEVQYVESWGLASATRIRPDGDESNRYQVYGLPEQSPLVTPVVQAGRWLLPDDGDAVVINATVAEEEPDLQPGGTVVLDMAGRERTYTVVGIVTTDAQGAKVYMNLRPFSLASRTPGKATTVQVVTHDPDGQPVLAEELRRDLETAGLDVYTMRTTRTLNAQNEVMFDAIIGFLIFMAVLLGAVGTLGLSTTLSINMSERIREIGVMRAIGASNGTIRRIVVLEGLLIALLSWGLGFVLSFSLARVASAQIGIALLDMPLAYTYAWGAAVTWLGVLLALALVASLGPAQQAVRLTVREVLAYE